MWQGDADYRQALIELFDLGAVLQGEASTDRAPRGDPSGRRG
jgi:hypothetical protein